MANDATFRHAIPGSSLTHKLGSYPHEKPPKYVDPNEALTYFWKQLNRPDILKQVWLMLEQGATVWAITRAVLYKAATMGIIQMNLMAVIAPTLGKMVNTVAQAKGIKAKQVPKIRDKVADQMMNSKLNEQLGNKNGKPLPVSALKSTILPKASEVTADAEKFMKMASPGQNLSALQPPPQNINPASAPKGLLAKANKGAI